ncbi:MAG: alpha/beta hydrolase [Kiloniellales bacterium]|nr:alpha/beta hydrolase [Kiloniellales bacterium]
MFEGFETRHIETSGAEIHLRRGGEGPPLLLLHGYPQTHVMWHKIAPRLAERFTVVAADLRGYGDSSKPDGGARHKAYAFRAMAQDQAEVMATLGYERFRVVGHDRGARVTHRLALDHPERVEKAAVLDIAPTLTMYERTDMDFARAYYHWFFLIQPFDLPERLIGADPAAYLERKIGAWSRRDGVFDPAAVAEYKRCFAKPEAIHASCEDYRAAADIDLEHDRADLHRKLACPLLVLWGAEGVVGRTYDVLAVWRERAEEVSGEALACGHFLAEERPEETLAALQAFL